MTSARRFSAAWLRGSWRCTRKCRCRRSSAAAWSTSRPRDSTSRSVVTAPSTRTRRSRRDGWSREVSSVCTRRRVTSRVAANGRGRARRCRAGGVGRQAMTKQHIVLAAAAVRCTQLRAVRRCRCPVVRCHPSQNRGTRGNVARHIAAPCGQQPPCVALSFAPCARTAGRPKSAGTPRRSHPGAARSRGCRS
jgi:hypothetical protein